MTIFLHIGFSKTGTTTIQTSMTVNAERLDREHGIHYLRSSLNHRLLAVGFLQGDPYVPLENFILHRLGTLDDARQGGEVLREELVRAARERNTILISAEQFQDLTTTTVARLRTFLVDESRHPVKIIVYVRHPLERLSSDMVQKIRSGRERLDTYVPKDSVTPVLRRYADAFGQENIIVRRFGRQYFVNGDLIDDFTAAMVGAPIRGLEEVGVQNASLSADAVLLADQLNRFAHLTSGQRGNVSYLHRIGGSPFRASREMAKRAAAEHAECMAYLAETFGIQFDPVDLEAFPEELPTALSNSALRDVAAILNDQSLEIERLRLEVRGRKPWKALRRRVKRFFANATKTR